MYADADPLMDPEHASFVTGAVSISVGSRDEHNLPDITRAFGCRLSDDRRRMSVFVSSEQSRAVLADIHAFGIIAVVFSQPSTHRTVQFKGRDAFVESLLDGDLERVRQYRDAFVAHLAALGYPGPTVRMMVECPPHELVTVSFSPTLAFSQTPGPKAGVPL